MKSIVNSDRYIEPHIPDFSIDEQDRQHSLVSPVMVILEQMAGHYNTRRSAELAVTPNGRLSVKPVLEFDCTHDAGPDLSLV